MRTFHFLSGAFLVALFVDLHLCCKNPQMVSQILGFHLFGNAMQHQGSEEDDLVTIHPVSPLQHCRATLDNCCSVDAENIYLAYKFADDISSVSKFGVIKSKLDSFFPIFTKPFIQSLEVYLSDIFASGIQSQLPPHQIATSISKLYSSVLLLINTPERTNYLRASIKNILLELKLITATHLINLNPGLQYCLSTDAEILNLLEIVKPNSADLSTYKIQENFENNLLKYLDHFTFFIELLSTFEQQKLSESCAASFEQLFFCRLCQSHNASLPSLQTNTQDVPQIIALIGSPCPHRCLNVIRGCYASLTGILPQLSQLNKDFIDLSRLLAQVTSKPTNNNGGAFLHNYFLDEMRAWSKKLEMLTPSQWTAIREKAKYRCTGNPPVERIDPTSTEGKAEVAEFLWPATENALNASQTQTPKNCTPEHMWPLIPTSKGLDELRSEQQQSYINMEQLIEEFILPERLFGEHLGQPCLLGIAEKCWNGHAFENDYEFLADFTRIGQLKNPTVKVSSDELDTVAARLGPKITARSQAIRSLVHKIRQRSAGEDSYETPTPLLHSLMPEEDGNGDGSTKLHPLGPILDIDEEGGLSSHFADLEPGSGLSPDYAEDWSEILARQQQQQNPLFKPDMGFGYEGVNNKPVEFEDEMHSTKRPATTSNGGRPVNRNISIFLLMLSLFVDQLLV